MPQGYVYLGSGDETFDKRFVQCKFELDKSMSHLSSYKACLEVIQGTIEEITDEQMELFKNERTGYKSKELAYAIAHCLVCTKHPINNMIRYCSPCEYYPKKYDRK